MINKKKILLICLITLIFIVLLLIEIITYLSSNEEKDIPIFNTAALQSSTKNESVNKVEKNANAVENKEEKTITIVNDSEEVIELNSCNWSYMDANFKGEYQTEGNEFFYKGFTLTREKNLISRIVFNKEYEGTIISGVYVGMNLNKVEKILGKPTFKDDNMLGYITQNLYVFIYEDEIAVYQNEFFANKELENMLVKYYKGEYKGTLNDFSRYIRNNYDDFIFSSDENKTTYLTSKVRGMKIVLDDSIRVELYKEYDSSNVLNSQMSDNIEFKEQYIAEVMENERITER